MVKNTALSCYRIMALLEEYVMSGSINTILLQQVHLHIQAPIAIPFVLAQPQRVACLVQLSSTTGCKHGDAVHPQEIFAGVYIFGAMCNEPMNTHAKKRRKHEQIKSLGRRQNCCLTFCLGLEMRELRFCVLLSEHSTSIKKVAPRALSHIAIHYIRYLLRL